MLVQTINNRRIQSIVLIVVLAVLAIAGLLLVMGQMASPERSSTTEHRVPESQSVEDEVGPQGLTAHSIENDVVATVNDKAITKQAWQQASRLDAAMSRLARRPLPTAEETLDRLVNEIIVLNGVEQPAAPPAAEIEARILTLAGAWDVSEETIVTALTEAELNRTDLHERVGRLIEVEAALQQLAEREGSLDSWLIKARASAEIGLYRSLVNVNSKPDPVTRAFSEDSAGSPEVAAQLEAEGASIDLGVPSSLPISPYPGNVAPDFILPQLDQEMLALSDFRGKPAVINFWATWCPPCRRELPALQAAYEAYRDEIGFVAVDVKEAASTVAPFVDQLDLTFPVVIDSDGSVSDVAYEVRGLPTTLFLDAKGVVSARHIGPLDEDLIEDYLAPLLEPAPDSVEQPQVSQISASPAGSASTPLNEIRLSTSTVSEPEQNNDAAAEANGSHALSMAGPAGVGGDQNVARPEDGLVTAPDFRLGSAGGTPVSLQDYRENSNVVLVFYRGHF